VTVLIKGPERKYKNSIKMNLKEQSADVRKLSRESSNGFL
jgi:hypothetical protein